MDLSVISVESIKPSLPSNNLKPFKLSLIDQFSPTTYSPLILFYEISDANLMKTKEIPTKLKISLSKTLDPFYPLSGRVQFDHLYVDDFHEGAPFIETRVKGRLSDFLQNPRLELLNEFLPCERLDPLLPQLAIQANIFDCGGLALAMGFSHQITDGITASCFLKSWAANATGSYDKVIQPNLFEASSMFPPVKHLPKLDMLSEGRWLREPKSSVRRFVFDENAIAALRAKSKSNDVDNPTRVQALCAFIWKSKMEAYKRVHNLEKPSMFMQAKNIRGVTKPRSAKHAMGNLCCLAGTRAVETDMEMTDLVKLMKEALDNVDSDFLSAKSNGSTGFIEQLNRLAGPLMGNLEVLICTSWNTFGFDDLDFGWGKPVWVGLFGKTSRAYLASSDAAVIKHVVGNKNAMEAWLILDEKIMDALETDSEFLAFASANPPIISKVCDAVF